MAVLTLMVGLESEGVNCCVLDFLSLFFLLCQSFGLGGRGMLYVGWLEIKKLL